jgi:hypothetical protein
VFQKTQLLSLPPSPFFFFLFTPLLSNLQNVQHFALFFSFCFAYRWAFYFKRKLLRIKKDEEEENKTFILLPAPATVPGYRETLGRRI